MIPGRKCFPVQPDRTVACFVAGEARTIIDMPQRAVDHDEGGATHRRHAERPGNFVMINSVSQADARDTVAR
jgi:hypothetical protein